MTTEGELTVRLAWDGQRVRDVAVTSSRPFAIGRLLTGRAPGEALSLVPRLYSLCAEAQGAAAFRALEAAGFGAPDPGCTTFLETRVLLEVVQEHVWRLLLDWPAAMGHAGLPQVVATARRAIGGELTRLDAEGQRTAAAAPSAERMGPRTIERVARLGTDLAALLEQHVFGIDVEAWLALPDATALAQWMTETRTLPATLLGELHARYPGLGRSDVALMPTSAADALRAAIVPSLRANMNFVRVPEWRGVPIETGPLSRWQTHPLIAALRARDGDTAATRMTARLVDLAIRIGSLRGSTEAGNASRMASGITLEPGEGLGIAETARGLLLHRARIAAGRIAAWDIVAPTEWNFHPRGALARGLSGITSTDRAAITRIARIAVQALDPCVGCRIEVTDA